jgi:hypothetical protein
MGLKTRVDPPRTFTPEEAAQWHKLQESFESELGEAGLSNTLFVDGEEGDNSNAQRGSLVFKYQTIAGAIAVAQAGDVIFISPGVYAEDVVMPGTLENVTLQGAGENVTFITNATAVATVRAVPTVDTVRSIQFKDLTIQNTSNLAALLINGTSDLNLGTGGRVLVQNARLTTNGALALDVDVCGSMEIFNVATNQNLNFDQVGRVLCTALRSGDILIDNDPTGAVPAAGFNGLVVTDGLLGNVTVSNLGVFAAAEDVQLNDLTGVLTDVAVAVGGRTAGSIIYWGSVLGDANVTFDFDDQAGQIPLILDGARMSGSLTFGLAVGGTGGNVARCRALHAKFYDTNAAITSNSEAVIDLRGSLYSQAVLVSADPEATGTAGTIDRSHWVQTLAAGNTGVNIAWANAGGSVPYPAAPTYVGHECVNVAEMPIAITTKTATQVAYTKGGADGSDVVVCAYREFD